MEIAQRIQWSHTCFCVCHTIEFFSSNCYVDEQQVHKLKIYPKLMWHFLSGVQTSSKNCSCQSKKQFTHMEEESILLSFQAVLLQTIFPFRMEKKNNDNAFEHVLYWSAMLTYSAFSITTNRQSAKGEIFVFFLNWFVSTPDSQQISKMIAKYVRTSTSRDMMLIWTVHDV